jgi:23S rRNA (uridine2552-2'-O)-methyltransferase
MSRSSQRRKPSSRAWLDRHVHDPFVHAAIREGYRARSAYKLKEIDDKDRLLQRGAFVVDLGAAPGSWTQVAVERLGLKPKKAAGKPPGGTPGTAPDPQAGETAGAEAARAAAGAGPAGGGRVVALDILPMDPVPGATFLEGDFREQSVLEALEAELGGRQVDVVLSDMAPNLSGIAVADAARSLLLAELALEFALAHLTPKGVFLVKAFHGSGFSQYVESLKKGFSSVTVRKPAASRAESAETYLLARSPRVRGA